MTIAVNTIQGRMALRKLTHEVIIESTNSRPASNWCEQHFGPRWNVINCRNGAWAMFWAGVAMSSGYRFVFAEERDAALFALRWL